MTSPAIVAQPTPGPTPATLGGNSAPIPGAIPTMMQANQGMNQQQPGMSNQPPNGPHVPYVSPSLYVGDLHPDVTETMLFEVFNSVGQVHSIRVCRDNVTRKSLGYAYVNYQSLQDAERSLDTLNYTQIKGIPCRIMWCQRDPSLRKSGNGNIFVKNLDKQIDNKALYDTFSLFGNILSCKVAVDNSGKSKGYGFVHYESDGSAKSAIEKVNGMLIGGKPVFVGPFIMRNDRESTSEFKFTNVYIKNLPKAWAEEDKLRPIMEKYGVVTSMQIKHDGKGRPFAFCNFEDHDAAKACMDDLNDRKVCDSGFATDAMIKAAEKNAEKEAKESESSNEKRECDDESGETKDNTQAATENSDDSTTGELPGISTLYVGPHQSKAQRDAMLRAKFEQLQNESRERYQGNLYIKNMDSSIDDDKLRSLFEPYGTVTSAKVMRDEKGVSKGFGFVCFVNAADATKAVNEMHLKHIKGKPLYVGMAEKREQRVQRLQQRFRMPNMRSSGPNGMAPGMGGNGPIHFPAGHAGMQGGYGGNSASGGGYAPRPLMGYPPQSSQMPVVHHWRQHQSSQPFNQQPGTSMGMRQMMNPLQIYNQNGAAGGMPMSQSGQNPQARGGPGSRAGRSSGQMPPNSTANNKSGYHSQLQSKQQPSGGSFKFTPQVRNQRMEQQMHLQQTPQQTQAGHHVQPHHLQNSQQLIDGNQPAVPPAHLIVSSDVPLTAAALAAAQPSMQKQMLGERLFPLISRYQPELAGKITGMMLEMDNSELLILLESEPQLKAKVDEALGVLRQAN